jgi:hypothetical protein
MFYLEREIKLLKKCPNCNNHLDDPRLLPYGQTIFSVCVDKTKQDDFYDCLFCNNRHAIPTDDFPVNNLAINLLKTRSREIYRGEAVSKLKNLLKQIKEECESILMCSREIILNKFGKMREEIRLKKEQLMNKIHIFE